MAELNYCIARRIRLASKKSSSHFEIQENDCAMTEMGEVSSPLECKRNDDTEKAAFRTTKYVSLGNQRTGRIVVNDLNLETMIKKSK